MANKRGESGNSDRLFSWAPKPLWMETAAMKLKDTCSFGRKAMRNLESILKSRDISLLTTVHLVKAMIFSVVMYGCESGTNQESRVPKNWCFWTVVLEETLETPLDCRENKPGNPKGISVLNIHWKDCCWSWNSNTLTTCCEELTP